MRARLQAWREETHGASCELLRHFLARFFDSETFAGEWVKVIISLFAALLSAGILVVKIYMWRYTVEIYERAGTGSAEPIYREWVRGDVLSFIAIAMAVTALLTALQWQRLFPGARDCLALAGLPVSARQVFAAKFAALLLLFGAFAAALNAPPAVSFAAVTAGPFQETPSGLARAAANFCATAGACVFVFFSLLALQGVLLNVLPGRLFARVSQWVEGAVFVLTLGALPLAARQPADAAWWPPVWFWNLRQAMLAGTPRAARNAVLAMLLPAAAAVLAYLASYHRYRRLLLEAPRDRAAARRDWGSWLLERWIRNPREQAAFAFIGKTLARSGVHRLILLAYAGMALGWITAGVTDTARPALRDQGIYGLVAVAASLAFSMLATIGLRYVFSLPVALGANWVFQMTDGDGRAAWLAAVERFVVWCGIAPVFAASLPAAMSILGPLRAAAAGVLALLAALVWFEAMFRRWRKLPFTCPYLPGTRPAWLNAARYGLALPLLAPAAQAILYSSGNLTAFTALFTLLAAAWWNLRAARRRMWSLCALRYEELPEAAVTTLDLQPAPAFQRPAAPRSEAPMFAGTLVASRGLLPQAWAEEMAEARRHPRLLLETFCDDVRYGFRQIRRNALLSGVVVLTLTAGIGINASVFTIVNGLALRPHVERDPASFVKVLLKARVQNAVRGASYAEYAAIRDRSRTLRAAAAWAHFPAFIGNDTSAGSIGMAVSCNFFAVDGVERAVAGRLFAAEDCGAGRPTVAVISEPVWRARFASDPGIVGSVVEVNNRPATVIGVAPARVAGWTRSAGWARPAGVWLPYTAHRHFEIGNAFADEHLWLSIAARLAPGYSRSDAEAELAIIARQEDRMHPGRNTAVVVTDGSWMDELGQTASPGQLMLLAFFFAAFNLVLFISCANVATLLLARAASRQREIAVRLSLGAPRFRLVRMLVTESLLLAAIAGAASLWLASVLPEPLFRLVASRAPDFPMPPDWRTFAYVAAAVTLSGVLAGLAPALASVRPGLAGTMRSPRRLEGAFVAAQVAMSMALLVCAGLFTQAEDRTLRADPGYQPRRLVVAPLYFPEQTHTQAAGARLIAVVRRIYALPGVRSVALTEGMPLFDRATVELRPPARADASQPVDVYSASPAFFETLGIPLLRGREFQVGETSAVIVSDRLARAFWPRQEALGQTLALPGGPRAIVVGVARDVDPLRFGGSDNPALYRPWRLHPVRNVLSVRFDSGAEAGAAAVRAALRETAPDLLVMARVAQSWIDQMTEDLWNVVALVGVLGVLATLLATAGIYGAVSFAVGRRTRELGIRAALGAGRLDIAREVFVVGGKPVAKGLLAGLWLSAGAGAVLRHGFGGMPVRLDTANPLFYGGAALLLAAAAALAMIAPARRGARADPLQVLRCD